MLLATVLAGSLCVVAYEQYARWMPPLHADEAGHAIPAARMALDLRGGDLRAFVRHTEDEMLWPFVHPWYLAAFFLAFGISTGVARASSLVAFAAALVAGFQLARALTYEPGSTRHPEGGNRLVGIVTLALMVVTADFWAQCSSVMIEPLGISLTLACLITHAAAVRNGSRVGFLVTGLLAALSFLAKYNYGVPLIAATLLAAALVPQPATARRKQLELLMAGVMLPILPWLAYPFPERLAALYRFSLNRDEGLSGLQDLFFYPLQMARLLSWPVTVVLLAAPLVSLRRVREPRVGASVLFALLMLAMITAHPNKQERYMFTLLPVLYVLAEVELLRLAGRWLRSPRAGALVWTLAAVVLAGFLDPRPVLLEQRSQYQLLRPAERIAGFIAARIGPQERTLVVGTAGLLPHLLVQWEMITRHGVADAVVDNLPFPGGQEGSPRYRRGYPPEMTPDYEPVLRGALSGGSYDKVAALAIADDSVFNPDWLRRWDAWGQNYTVLMERQSLYPKIAEQDFPECGVRVRLYAKP